MSGLSGGSCGGSWFVKSGQNLAERGVLDFSHLAEMSHVGMYCRSGAI